jgi:hypothetical protein
LMKNRRIAILASMGWGVSARGPADVTGDEVSPGV